MTPLSRVPRQGRRAFLIRASAEPSARPPGPGAIRGARRARNPTPAKGCRWSPCRILLRFPLPSQSGGGTGRSQDSLTSVACPCETPRESLPPPLGSRQRRTLFFRERGAHMRWLAFKGWRFYRSRCCFRTPPAGVNFYSFNMPAQGEGMEAAVSSGRPSRALMLLPRIIPGDEPVRCR